MVPRLPHWMLDTNTSILLYYTQYKLAAFALW
jgi:hypothetical protein